MIVTIHQPEHFPYMGFFQKASVADVLVLLDTVKFRKNYFQNRNRMIDAAGNEIWFTVPVRKGSSSLPIKEVMVSKDDRWRKKVLSTIKHSMGFDAGFLYDYENLSDINVAGIRWAFNELNISTKIVMASDLHAAGSKSELLANICREMNAETYISGPSGKHYLNEEVFADVKIEYFSPSVENHLSCLYNICNRKADT
ncbi:MAG: hypothetical protein CMA72_09570 [Euryarchaeota archaeon]|nr:hypothetical protein [Euryarchaeota archaeon]